MSVKTAKTREYQYMEKKSFLIIIKVFIMLINDFFFHILIFSGFCGFYSHNALSWNENHLKFTCGDVLGNRTVLGSDRNQPRQKQRIGPISNNKTGDSTGFTGSQPSQ